MLFKALLTIHIIAGFTALAAAFAAIVSKTLDSAHRWHVYSGRIYFGGMVIIFLTAIPMSLLHPSPFLFLIALLSFYLALNGWRLAKNRRGTPHPLDWGRAGIMLGAAVAMVLLGGYMLLRGDSNGIIIIVFGLLGGKFSVSDLKALRTGGLTGKARIAQHVTMMLGGTIATVTAFVVTNFTVQPAFVLWLAPTVVLTPVIVWWNRRIQAGRRPKGMP